MADKVLLRGFSCIPYDTLRYTASAQRFVDMVTTDLGGTIVDIEWINIPNAIVVAIHYTV